jgi:hypothetical protein
MPAQLGDLSFRIEPSQVFFTYDVDTAVIPTIGGRVVQAYGATLGDLTIQGTVGEDRLGGLEGWVLAEQFQAAVGQMVIAQSTPPNTGQLSGNDATPMHPPVRFFYSDETHTWDLMVYIKALKDIKSDYTVAHETGKFFYGYTLTLFIVEDNTGTLKAGIVDEFINRLADGVGWSQSAYNGYLTTAEMQAYVTANSPDGTIHGLLLKQYSDSSLAFLNGILPNIATGGAATGEGTQGGEEAGTGAAGGAAAGGGAAGGGGATGGGGGGGGGGNTSPAGATGSGSAAANPATGLPGGIDLSNLPGAPGSAERIAEIERRVNNRTYQGG